MRNTERITVTLPEPTVREIDRWAGNRSLFVQAAVRRELARRRRESLRASVDRPHTDGPDLAEAGFDEWASSLPAEEASALVDTSAGRPIRWIQDRGWIASEP